MQAGAVSEAWHPVRCALTLEPSSSPGLTLAGQIAVRRNASATAVRYFARAAQANRHADNRVLLNLARAQQMAGQLEPAIGTARRAAQLLPDDVQVRGFLALLLLTAGRTSEGAAALHPGDENRIDGKLALRLGDRLKAEPPFADLSLRLLSRALTEPSPRIAEALAALAAGFPTGDPRQFATARRALILSPAEAPAMDAIAAAFAALGKPAYQANWVWRSWVIDPDDPRRLGRAAKLTFEARKWRHALAANTELLRLRPGVAMVVERLCELYIQTKDRPGGLAFGRSQLVSEPDDPRIWNAIAGLFKSVEAYDETAELWPEIIRRFSYHHSLHYNYALFLDEQNLLEQSARRARASLLLKPDYVYGSNHLSLVEHRLHRLRTAERYARWTLAVDPAYANAYMNLGNFLRAAGNYGPAIECFTRAAQVSQDDHPTAASSRYNAGMLKIGIGELEDGFRLIQARWATAEFPSPKRPFRQRIWPGPHAAPGASLLLYMEQGLGDEVMMSWYLPLVRRGVRRLVVECDHRLTDMFSRTYEGIEFVPAVKSGHPTAHDPDIAFKVPSFHVPQYYVAEIKRLIRDNWDWAHRGGTRFPSRLAMAPERADHWRRWLADRFPDRPRIAVSWRSRLRNRDRDRQYLEIDQIASVIPPGAAVINLQYSSTDDEIAEFQAIGRRRGFDVVTPDGVDLTNDLEDILTILQEVDVAVTPLISLAWMAGAMGCPAYVFRTSSEHQIWHQMGTPFLPWVPSLKLFFRNPAEPWEPTVADVRQSLADFLQSHRPGTIDRCPVAGGRG